MIDLRSDTVTRPTPEMLRAMFEAEVGDDVFEEDPTVIRLEQKAASMFGKEAGLFCTSGTLTNQIGIKIHTQPGDEVICDKNAHVYLYEGGGIAFNSGCQVRLLEGNRGRITAPQVKENINADNVHYPVSRLVCLENTANRGGGSVYDIEEIRKISVLCREQGLGIHLDGARIFNALVAKGQSPVEIGLLFDTISVCLSKGLGAPVGSVLLGTKEHIRKARRIRKIMGGGFRQAGYLAAAGIYALDHHITRLAEDHKRAKILEQELKKLNWVEGTLLVETNIVVVEVDKKTEVSGILSLLEKDGVKAVAFGKNAIRMVTHLDFDDEMLERTISVLKNISIPSHSVERASH